MKLKTTNIKGKEYVEVNERIRAFRMAETFKGYRLVTKVIEATQDFALMEAQVLNAQGIIVANGHASELRSAGHVNKTSHIENCETSAWGRALGNLGIGVDTSVASAEEVEHAIAQQEAIKKATDKLRNIISELTNEFKDQDACTSILKTLNIESWKELKDFSEIELMEANALLTK